MEKISVLIPVFNRELYIKQCLNSILKQAHSNLEIIIYDDGSSDNTVSILKAIPDKRIKLYKGKKNKGLVGARNALLNLVKTNVACWQDSDDISNIHRISMQYNYMKDLNIILTTGQSIFKMDNQINYIKPPKKIVEPDIKKGCFASIMFKMDNVIKFSNDCALAGEDIRWMNDMRNEGVITKNLDYILYHIRHHDDRVSIKKRLIRGKGILCKDIHGNIIPYEDLLKKI